MILRGLKIIFCIDLTADLFLLLFFRQIYTYAIYTPTSFRWAAFFSNALR